jgi:outer membrane protein assembly factor BamB
MVDAAGGVIAADSARVIRFDPDGDVIWDTATPGGLPISPVITENGTVVLATWNGPVSAYDSETGEKLAELWIREYPGDPGFFETTNTPGVRVNRVYVSAHHQVDRVVDEDNLAWLVAIDVDPTNPDPSERLRIAWHFEFGGPSGASPLVIGDTVYFDGDRPAPGTAQDPHVFALQDNGTAVTEKWRQAMTSTIVASFARDPRGGLWVYPYPEKWLIRLDEGDGSEMQRIDVDALVAPSEAGSHFPSSAMTITEPDSAPAMLLSAFAGNPSSTYVAAIDLASASLLWKVKVADAAGVKTAGQFPILQGYGRRVVFSTFDDGVWAIGDGSVGGIAEFPPTKPEAEVSPGEAGTSGSGTVAPAAAAGGGLLLLGVGAWHAMRRRQVTGGQRWGRSP